MTLNEKNLNDYWPVIQNCPIPAFLLNINGIIAKHNSALLDLVGYTRKEIENHPEIELWLELLIPDRTTSQEAIELFKRALKNETSLHKASYTITVKNGQMRYVEFSAFHFIINGKPTDTLVVIAIDTTESKYTEYQLREIEGRYSALFYRSPDLVYIHDLQGKLIDVNPAMLRTLGYRRKDIGSLSMSSIVIQSQLPIALETLEQIKQNGYQKNLTDFVFKRKDGGLVHVQTNGILLHRNGESYAVIVIGRNITEQMKNEEIRRNYINNMDFLAKSSIEFVQISSDDNIYKMLAEKLLDSIENAIIAVSEYDDSNGIIETKALAGLGKHLDSFIRLWGRHPVGMTYPVDEETKNLMLSGKLIRIGGLHELSLKQVPETVCRTLEAILGINAIYGIGFASKGKLFGITTITSFNTTKPINTEFIETFCSQVSVVLSRWKAEKALKASEEKYHNLAENINDILYSLNDEGMVTYIGPQIKKLGFDPEDILNKALTDFIRPDDCESTKKDFRHSMETGEKTPTRLRIRDKQGAIHWFEDNGTVQRSAEGAIIGLTGILRDITRRINIEKALRISDSKLRDQKEKLELKNIALKELIDHIETEKNSIKDQVITNVDDILIPILDKIRIQKNPSQYIELLRHLLRNLTSSFGRKLTMAKLKLTPREIEICSMIESGLRTKEIAELLNVSTYTIENHRKNIRKKLNIRNMSINLSSCLTQLNNETTV